MLSPVPQRLSPEAARLSLSLDRDGVISSIVLISAKVDRDELRRGLENLGITIRSWDELNMQISADIPIRKLRALASVPGVRYVEAGETFSA